VENRRRAERQSALWMSRCQVEAESLDLWQACAIFDISTFGMGIDLAHSGTPDILSRRITVLLELGPSVDVTVAGEVRNAESGPDGIVRTGIEFVGLNETERSIVGLLERRAMSRSRNLLQN
jgi:PilZ domain